MANLLDTLDPIFAFTKGQIEGRVMGQPLGGKGTIGKQGRTL